MRTRSPLTTILLGAALVALIAAPLAAGNAFPNTKQLGKTVVKYEDDHAKAVVGYRWAANNHDQEFIFFDTAVTASLSGEVEVWAEGVELIAPDGTRIALATQKEVLEGIDNLNAILRAGAIMGDPLSGYFFAQTREDRIPFFALPGTNVVFERFAVDRLTVAYGKLFFQSPTGSFPAGLYTLVLNSKKVRIEIPIELVTDEERRAGIGGL